MSFDLPQAPTVTGYALRVGVGSCPDADSEPGAYRDAASPARACWPTSRRTTRRRSASSLCVRLWTSGEKGRLSQASTTTQIQYQPDPLPPPPSLTAAGIRGGANLSWPRDEPQRPDRLRGRLPGRRGLPGRPADAPAGQRAGFTAAQAEGGVRLSALPGRYCVGVWSRDGFGRISASAATALGRASRRPERGPAGHARRVAVRREPLVHPRGASRAARREPAADRARRAAPRAGAQRHHRGDGRRQDRARARAGPAVRRQGARGDRAARARPRRTSRASSTCPTSCARRSASALPGRRGRARARAPRQRRGAHARAALRPLGDASPTCATPPRRCSPSTASTSIAG